MRGGVDEWIGPLFPEEEIPHVLSSILRCGAVLRKQSDTELENSLSDRLRDLLDRDPEFRRRPIEHFREIPIYDRRAARRKPLGRGDIFFVFSTGANKPWPYFLAEAKRLHVTFPSGWNSLVSEYVSGEQGMMCFVKGRYARGLVYGGMLGYVFDGRVDKARASVASAIEKSSDKLKCTNQKTLVVSNVVPGEKGISETVHALPRRFTIFHQFLSV